MAPNILILLGPTQARNSGRVKHCWIPQIAADHHAFQEDAKPG
ncbi:uncharacterized protein METZ01_LOCUS161963, partial [marine metagenome]